MDLKFYDENNYLISMTPADKIIEAGTVLGLNDKCIFVYSLCHLTRWYSLLCSGHYLFVELR